MCICHERVSPAFTERKGVPEATGRFPKLEEGDSWTGEEGDSLCEKCWPWIQDATRGKLTFVSTVEMCADYACERACAFGLSVE